MGIMMRIIMENYGLNTIVKFRMMMDSIRWPYDSSDCLLYFDIVVMCPLSPYDNLVLPPQTVGFLQKLTKAKKGSDSDHNIEIFSPISNPQFKKDRIKTTITHRPLPQSKIQDFGQDLVPHFWMEVLEEDNGHQKAVNFHNTLMWFRDKHFPEKSVKCCILTRAGCIQSLGLLQ